MLFQTLVGLHARLTRRPKYRQFKRSRNMSFKVECVSLLILGLSVSSEQSVLQDLEPGTPLSRFDYEYQLLKKTVDLEMELSLLKKKMGELEANQDLSRTTACDDGWLAYKGSCYLFGPSRSGFTSAKEFCDLNGAYLVRVENVQEDTFLRTFMDNHLNENADYWLGINDNVIEGVWKFTDDGTNAPYLGWGGTEPQDAGTNGEDCAAFGHLLKYKWIDVPCTSLRRPLCEKKPMKPMAISFQRHDSD